LTDSEWDANREEGACQSSQGVRKKGRKIAFANGQPPAKKRGRGGGRDAEFAVPYLGGNRRWFENAKVRGVPALVNLQGGAN